MVHHINECLTTKTIVANAFNDRFTSVLAEKSFYTILLNQFPPITADAV